MVSRAYIDINNCQYANSHTLMDLLLTLEVIHKKTSPDTTSTPHPDVSPQISQETTLTPKPLTVDRLEALLQMQRTDPFCKCISK